MLFGVPIIFMFIHGSGWENGLDNHTGLHLLVWLPCDVVSFAIGCTMAHKCSRWLKHFVIVVLHYN
jgi:hypothetical protein